MNDAEETIAKVLKGLRDQEAAPGLESRILRALQEHAPQRAPSRWRALALGGGSGFRVGPGVLALLSAACLAALLTVSRVVSHVGGPLRAADQQQAHGSESRALPVLAGGSTSRRTDLGPKAQSVEPVILPATRLRRSPASAKPAWKAASFPAPPLPLTKQERLLLEVASSRKLAQVAPLELQTQVAEAERDKQEFSRFFQHEEGATNEPN